MGFNSKKKKNKYKPYKTSKPGFRKRNYLKYIRVLRYYIRAKYGLPDPEMEMLLFLYDRTWFTKKYFIQFGKLMRWNRRRLEQFFEVGLLERIPTKKDPADGRLIYSSRMKLSLKARRIVEHYYDIIEGGEIPSHHIRFEKQREVNSTDEIYIKFIEEVMKKGLLHDKRELSEEAYAHSKMFSTRRAQFND